jgi:hypothetical protein
MRIEYALFVPLLILGNYVIFFVSGHVEKVISPSDSRESTWIMFHAFTCSPVFIVGYVGTLIAFRKMGKGLLKSLIAFAVGIAVWGLVFAMDLHYKVIPAIKEHEASMTADNRRSAGFRVVFAGGVAPRSWGGPRLLDVPRKCICVRLRDPRDQFNASPGARPWEIHG